MFDKFLDTPLSMSVFGITALRCSAKKAVLKNRNHGLLNLHKFKCKFRKPCWNKTKGTTPQKTSIQMIMYFLSLEKVKCTGTYWTIYVFPAFPWVKLNSLHEYYGEATLKIKRSNKREFPCATGQREYNTMRICFKIYSK